MENNRVAINQKFEIETKKIIKHYTKLLNNVENEYIIEQNDHLENFFEEQELKLEHENEV